MIRLAGTRQSEKYSCGVGHPLIAFLGSNGEAPGSSAGTTNAGIPFAPRLGSVAVITV